MKNKIVAMILAISMVGISPTFMKPIKVEAASVKGVYNVLTGTTVHVLPRYTQASGTTYTYTSSNTNIATVDSEGNVTGVSAGTATIIVKRTITNTETSKVPSEEKVSLNKVSRESNMTASNLDDWNTPTTTVTPVSKTTVTPTPVVTGTGSLSNHNYIEGLTDATPTPIKKATQAPTVTSAASASGNAIKTTSVSSYARYTVNVVPLSINADRTTIGVGDTLKVSTNLAEEVVWDYAYTGGDAFSFGLGSGKSFEFTPMRSGEYTLRATYNSGSDEVTTSIDLKVNEKSEKQKELEAKNLKKVKQFIDKKGFSFTDATTSLAAGDSVVFNTNLDNLGYADVEWTSSDTKIATVSSKGLVKGLSEGTVKITAKAGGKKISVKVKVDKDSVFRLTSSTDKIAVGDTFNLKTNKTEGVKWSTDNENILAVENGVVTGKAIGTTTVTAVYNGTTLKKTIQVTGDTTMLRVTSTSNTVNVGERIALETNRKGCIFSVDDKNIASIDPDTGVLKGKTKGTTNVVITCGSEQVVYRINVTEGTSELSFVGLTDSLAAGDKCYLQTNKPNASFISSNTAVASIDRNTGELKALTEGVTVIYAFSGTEQISQQIKVTEVAKGDLLHTLFVGDSAQLSSGTENVTWSSSNQNVVKVDELTGKLTAIAPGSCMIYTYADDKISFVEVSVRAAKYTKEQQKAISDADKYVRTLLSEDGESLRIISSANAETILTYLKECRKHLDKCEDLGINIKTLSCYSLYDAGLNQYLLSAKGYSDGTLITLDEARTAAIKSIDTAILKATSSSTDELLLSTINQITDLIENAKSSYLITEKELSMYDVYEQLLDYVITEKEGIKETSSK